MNQQEERKEGIPKLRRLKGLDIFEYIYLNEQQIEMWKNLGYEVKDA